MVLQLWLVSDYGIGDQCFVLGLIMNLWLYLATINFCVGAILLFISARYGLVCLKVIEE